MKNRTIELENGLQVVHTYIPYTRAVHCGYIINAGSRDDRVDQLGMAHFIEHMIFKGTEKRKTFHILNYLESVGGDLDTYTSKEKICVYASIASEYAARATELLTDICFFSTFPEKEIEKEKQVISEEIDMYRNIPDEAIFEDFDDFLFPSHSLGHPILGYKESIQKFQRQDIQVFTKSRFTQENIIFSIVGNIKAKEVDRLVAKYLRPLILPISTATRASPLPFTASEKKASLSTNQTHEILGGRAYSMTDKKYFPFQLLNNMLGGAAMNSRLNLNIREKYGLTYNISSFFSPYTDCGTWGIYYACEPKNSARIRRMVHKELKSLREKKLGVIQLSQAKKQLTGQLTLGYENLLTQMLSNAKETLNHGRVISFKEYIDQIDQITAAQILDVANECFSVSNIARLTLEGNTSVNGNHVQQIVYS